MYLVFPTGNVYIYVILQIMFLGGLSRLSYTHSQNSLYKVAHIKDFKQNIM